MEQLFAFLSSPLFSIITNVLAYGSLAFCFSKMGLTPWKALIPIYGVYCLFDAVMQKQGMLYFFIYLIGLFLYPSASSLVLLLGLISLYKCFGKGIGFCLLWGFFAPFIGVLICAFDNSVFMPVYDR